MQDGFQSKIQIDGHFRRLILGAFCVSFSISSERRIIIAHISQVIVHRIVLHF